MIIKHLLKHLLFLLITYREKKTNNTILVQESCIGIEGDISAQILHLVGLVVEDLEKEGLSTTWASLLWLSDLLIDFICCQLRLS